MGEWLLARWAAWNKNLESCFWCLTSLQAQIWPSAWHFKKVFLQCFSFAEYIGRVVSTTEPVNICNARGLEASWCVARLGMKYMYYPKLIELSCQVLSFVLKLSSRLQCTCFCLTILHTAVKRHNRLIFSPKVKWFVVSQTKEEATAFLLAFVINISPKLHGNADSSKRVYQRFVGDQETFLGIWLNEPRGLGGEPKIDTPCHVFVSLTFWHDHRPFNLHTYRQFLATCRGIGKQYKSQGSVKRSSSAGGPTDDHGSSVKIS